MTHKPDWGNERMLFEARVPSSLQRLSTPPRSSHRTFTTDSATFYNSLLKRILTPQARRTHFDGERENEVPWFMLAHKRNKWKQMVDEWKG